VPAQLSCPCLAYDEPWRDRRSPFLERWTPTSLGPVGAIECAPCRAPPTDHAAQLRGRKPSPTAALMARSVSVPQRAKPSTSRLALGHRQLASWRRRVPARLTVSRRGGRDAMPWHWAQIRPQSPRPASHGAGRAKDRRRPQQRRVTLPAITRAPVPRLTLDDAPKPCQRSRR
jgi:hypothetical protein